MADELQKAAMSSDTTKQSEPSKCVFKKYFFFLSRGLKNINKELSRGSAKPLKYLRPDRLLI